MWLQLSAAPAGSLSLQLHDPNYQKMTLTSAGQNRWKAFLPQDGDYEIWGRPRKKWIACI